MFKEVIAACHLIHDYASEQDDETIQELNQRTFLTGIDFVRELAEDSLGDEEEDSGRTVVSSDKNSKIPEDCANEIMDFINQEQFKVESQEEWEIVERISKFIRKMYTKYGVA